MKRTFKSKGRLMEEDFQVKSLLVFLILSVKAFETHS